MSEPVTYHKGGLLAQVAVIAALVGASFGFFAGIAAGSPSIRASVASALPESLRGWAHAAQPGPAKPEGAVTIDLSSNATEEERMIAVVEKASPAVVSIVVSKDVPVYEQYYSNPFFPQYRQNGTQHQEIGAGSGFFVSADGYVVTNRHVVADETAQYTVILQDGRKYDTKVLARDPANDIAVMKVEKAAEDPDFTFLAYGDSSTLRVGQRVMTIGYALGRFGNSVSTGIVSGLERSISAGDGRNRAEDLFGVIQTDAAINPGNSGGPLLNLFGEVVGVNVAIVQGSQNIGFSLPANDVQRVTESVQRTGKISRPFFGVRYTMVNADLKERNQLPVDYGAIVARGETPSDLAVMPGSPADVAGIEENDIILEINGKKLNADNPLFVAVAKLSAGETITMKILHKGEEKDIQVTLTERQ